MYFEFRRSQSEEVAISFSSVRRTFMLFRLLVVLLSNTNVSLPSLLGRYLSSIPFFSVMLDIFLSFLYFVRLLCIVARYTGLKLTVLHQNPRFSKAYSISSKESIGLSCSGNVKIRNKLCQQVPTVGQ